jgi:serum/glucocorticoid-regulated kinase 2
MDHLGLGKDVSVAKMIATKSKHKELVMYSGKEQKINRKNVSQTRVLLITDRAIYNLKPSNLSNCKRRILIEEIGEIICAKGSTGEFVLHIPNEYDYRYKSNNRTQIVELLEDLFYKKTGKRLDVTHVLQTSLKDLTRTRVKVMNGNRDDASKKKKDMVNEKHESDDELPDDKDVSEIDVNDGTKGLKKNDGKPRLDDFELLKVLGRGAFGKVMQVRKKDTGKIYAMKILKKTVIFSRKQVDHTKAERQILQAFRHPYLMSLNYAFQTPSKLYLVMDFFKGGELFFHLRKHKRFTEEQARFIVAQVKSLMLSEMKK